VINFAHNRIIGLVIKSERWALFSVIQQI